MNRILIPNILSVRNSGTPILQFPQKLYHVKGGLHRSPRHPQKHTHTEIHPPLDSQRFDFDPWPGRAPRNLRTDCGVAPRVGLRIESLMRIAVCDSFPTGYCNNVTPCTWAGVGQLMALLGSPFCPSQSTSQAVHPAALAQDKVMPAMHLN